jgi:hypothetical protein
LPRFSVVDHDHAPAAAELPAGAAALQPWAASPRTETWSRHWRPAIDADGDGARWDPETEAPHRKSTAARVLAALLLDPEPGWMASEDAPRVAEDLDSVLRVTDELRKSGHEVVAVKAELGTSGRGISRLLGAPTAPQLGAIRRLLARDGAVVVEPWVDRVCDLSFRFTANPDGIALDDIGRFLTDERGQYVGAVLGRPTGGLPPEIQRFMHEGERLHRAARRIADALAAEPVFASLRGPVGVDAMIYRDRHGALALRPILEINPRANMGHLAWRVGRIVAPGRAGVLLLRSPEGLTGLPGPVFETRGAKRYLAGGALVLSDPSVARRCVAVVGVGATLPEAGASASGTIDAKGGEVFQAGL